MIASHCSRNQDREQWEPPTREIHRVGNRNPEVEIRGGRSVHAPAVLLIVWALLVVAQVADARKIPVRKYSSQWTELRSADGEQTQQIERISRFRDLKSRLPQSAHHGHLQLGEPRLPSLDRVELSQRAGRRGGAPDTTLRVAVIRIEFETDRRGDETTGDGRFMRENPDPDRIFIDPPPHDDRYFAAHLEAVNRYWASMTYGRVAIEGDVFPRGDRFGAYRLSDMEDFGPKTEDEFFNIDGLVDYSRQSLIAADQDPDLVWSEYDVYFVVHAGSDWQNDVFQDSRFDLPTFSISFSDSEVVVTNDMPADTLTTMITYPETSSQDGFAVALNGGIAHEMGHQLGLFDIYNVETFAPTVGFYSVMDSGNLASVFVQRDDPDLPGQLLDVEVIGALPTAIGAWSRWFVTAQFGLDPPLLKRDVGRLRLHAVQSRTEEDTLPENEYKWFRLPVSATEYFMVENRVDDLDGRLPDGSFNTALDQDDSTGVILGPIKGDSDSLSHNYDLLIDPGVLIWHVDERQARANLSRGRGLNVIFEKRSITIEEADGFVDIGNPFSLSPLGTPNEAWHEGNASNFSSTTRPNSHSNLGTPTGIAVTDIGPRGQSVVMDVALGRKPVGWPMEIGPWPTGGLTSTTLADMDGDGVAEVAACGPTGVFLFRYGDADGDGDADTPGIWPATGAPTIGTPVQTQITADFDGDGQLELAATTDSGDVYVWNADGSPWSGANSAGVLLQFPPTAGPTWSPLAADLTGDGADELYLATEDGRLRGYNVELVGNPVARFPARRILGAQADSVASLITTLGAADANSDGRLQGFLSYVHQDSVFVQRFDAEGRRTFRRGHPLPAGYEPAEQERVWMIFGDMDRADSGTPEIVLALQSGFVCVYDATVKPLPGWPVVLDGPLGGSPALGDVDGDGFLELAVTSGLNVVHAFNYNATEMKGWPVRVELADFELPPYVPSPPAIADVDGDGRQDIVVGFTDFTIRAITPDGKEASGFPLSAGMAPGTTPAILDANGDGLLDLFIQAGDGTVAGHILSGAPSRTNPQWPMAGGGPQLHGRYDPARMPMVGGASGQVLEGGVVVYPNPVREYHSDLRVRYTLGPNLEPATQVEIKLYNVSGEIVLARNGTAFASSENELVVSADELKSGVYFCTIRARSGARVETAQGKFAVLR